MKRNMWWAKDDIDENLRQHELSIVIVYDYLSLTDESNGEDKTSDFNLNNPK